MASRTDEPALNNRMADCVALLERCHMIMGVY